MTQADALLSYSFARAHNMVLQAKGARHELVLAPNAARELIPELARHWPNIAKWREVDSAAFDALLSEIYAHTPLDGDTAGLEESLDSVLQGAELSADLLDGDDDAPIIRLLNGLLGEAVRGGASDIHFEPFEQVILVRLRIDGVLQEIAELPSKLAPYLASRVKVMARLDIAEKRLPQDGRFSLTLGGKLIDVRVSVLPIRYGERLVLRLLDKDNARADLQDLGMDSALKRDFATALAAPNGIILVTGPTGAGKTTTLYAALGLLNDQTRNIMTVEDPVEYALAGISQTQVNSKTGMSFALGLRAILRQDPDVVMVGEIRDRETAEIAVQASLTGHLVLSTVHTNSAAAAITRLLDIGIEPFLMASSIKAVLAQRLVRRLCAACKRPTKAGQYEAVGCAACQQTGYRGRLAIFEMISVDDTLRQMIQEQAAEQAIAAYAFTAHETLADGARAAVERGLTTAEEVLRVARYEAAA